MIDVSFESRFCLDYFRQGTWCRPKSDAASGGELAEEERRPLLIPIPVPIPVTEGSFVLSSFEPVAVVFGCPFDGFHTEISMPSFLVLLFQ